MDTVKTQERDNAAAVKSKPVNYGYRKRDMAVYFSIIVAIVVAGFFALNSSLQAGKQTFVDVQNALITKYGASEVTFPPHGGSRVVPNTTIANVMLTVNNEDHACMIVTGDTIEQVTALCTTELKPKGN